MDKDTRVKLLYSQIKRISDVAGPMTFQCVPREELLKEMEDAARKLENAVFAWSSEFWSDADE